MVKRNLDGFSEAHLPQKICAQGHKGKPLLQTKTPIFSMVKRNLDVFSEAHSPPKKLRSGAQGAYWRSYGSGAQQCTWNGSVSLIFRAHNQSFFVPRKLHGNTKAIVRGDFHSKKHVLNLSQNTWQRSFFQKEIKEKYMFFFSLEKGFYMIDYHHR
jgi:hypothetical protein